MKIVPKLTVGLVAGTCAILTINGALRIQRETGAIEAELARDHEMVGRALAAAVAATWKSEGEEPALAGVQAVNEHFPRIRIRWRGLDERAGWHVDPKVIETSPAGMPFTQAVRDADGDRRWYTYVPIEVEGRRRGALELEEASTTERRLVYAVVRDAVATALALALLNAFMVLVVGQWLVGASVRALSDKARKIARGDFSDPVRLRGDDELVAVADEMNAMCEQLTSTLEQLRHADRLATVGRLAAGVAHELGTPLNVVSARADLIAAGDSTLEEARDYARVIHGAAGRMAQIIRQLLQFARRKAVTKASADLRTVTEETLELLRPLASKRAIRLELAQNDVDTVARADVGQVQQVVTNLVMNAIHAVRRGGRIELEFSGGPRLPPPDVGGPERDCLCLTVRDDGEGISAETLPHIFEPFFTTKDVGEGTGLGLPVSYGIMRDHGGWISVMSEVGVGTTFTIAFPRTTGPDRASPAA